MGEQHHGDQVMQILIYDCKEAPPNLRFCARFLSDGRIMPVTAYRPTRAEAEEVAWDFLRTEVAKMKASKISKPKSITAAPPSVQTPRSAASVVSDFEDLL